MKNASEIDFLVVGQGLAGSAFAMRALALGYRLSVLDQPSQNRSSSTAAGLFNPITGRNFVKTWLADQIFPILQRYYSEVERLTGKKFFYPLPLYKPLASVEAQNEWMGRSADPLFANYISGACLPGAFKGKVKDPFGGIMLRQTGYIDTKSYLKAVRGFLNDRAAFHDTAFDAGKLEIGDGFIRYGNTAAKKIVFCQGVEHASNPWFSDVPIKSLKGEFLTVQCELEKDVILNGGVHIVPDPHTGQWRVGSTYNRNDHTPEITSEAREELVRKMEDLISVPYTITGQHWGVRPTTPDRKPVLGAHRRHKSMVIFNGFGTKGVSLAPYFSDVLIRWMENKGTILKEADVTRFY